VGVLVRGGGLEAGVVLVIELDDDPVDVLVEVALYFRAMLELLNL
jgi:hypothetical protein